MGVLLEIEWGVIVSMVVMVVLGDGIENRMVDGTRPGLCVEPLSDQSRPNHMEEWSL